LLAFGHAGKINGTVLRAGVVVGILHGVLRVVGQVERGGMKIWLQKIRSAVKLESLGDW